MNQDIHELVEQYVADSDISLTDCYNDLLQRCIFDLSAYVCTDPDCLQFAKEESEHFWHYIQRVDDGPFHKVVSASVDLNHYKEIEIEQCINAFGYTKKKDMLGSNYAVSVFLKK